MEIIKKIKKNLPFLLLMPLSLSAALFIGAYYIFSLPDFNWSGYNFKDFSPRTGRLLDGRDVSAKDSGLRPIAVVLENHFNARPVAGLEQASIIYEVIVEGDITRFLAIFDQNISIGKIGPIRSVRPFFIELAEEWGAVLFHAGGSPDAMYKLTYSPVYNINEISGDGIYFWRDKNRSMPHNLVTSADLISRAINAKEIDQQADFAPWQFKKSFSTTSAEELISEIEVKFSQNPDYAPAYQYNQSLNNYTRYQAGQVHKTEAGMILTADNIIIQHVDFRIIDDYGRLEIDLKTGGLAEVYRDGQKIIGRWQKTSGRTRFYDKTNKEIRLNQGTTWVELVFN